MRRILAFFAVLATSAAMASAADGRWRPSPADGFDWQYVAPFDFSRPTSTLNLDAFDADPALIADLRRRGVKPICYVNVGAWEDWRPDRRQFPAAVMGKAYVGWEGERWLDVRRIDLLLPIMRARFRLCRDKGFLAVEPDNIDGFENETGFPISRAEQLRFNRAIAEAAHDLGLSIALKNAPELAAELADVYDFAIAEDCFKWDWCDMLQPFARQNKAVVAIEYPEDGRDPLKHCAEAAALSIQIVVKRRELDSWSRRCR
mgnify:CR=1 FL=1